MPTVLVVDDDSLVVTALGALLEMDDIRFAVAGDRETAEAMLAEQYFPLVLADLRLRTEEDGLMLIEAVRRLSPRTRVAAMTGHATPALEASVRELGVSTLLHKPFEADEFLAVIHELLAAAGNPEDLGAIYTAVTPRLRSMVARRFRLSPSDCDDVLQQAFCLLLEKHFRIRDVGAWLAGTVCNLARQLIHVRAREHDVEDFERLCIVDRDPSGTIALRSALAKLDERSRQLCALIGVERLSYAEASTALAMPLGSVGPLFMRAKERLRRELQ
jgi:RNA polymerase sigma factor (sigma-70 family)